MRIWFISSICFVAVVLSVFAIALRQQALEARSLVSIVSRPVPEFVAASLDGQKTLSDRTLKGPIIVNFFASWCGPCLREHPFLMGLKRQGVPVIGISLRDKKPRLEAWLKQHGNPYDFIGFDPKGITAESWKVSGLPETFIVDRKNMIRFHQLGPINADTVARFMSSVFKK